MSLSENAANTQETQGKVLLALMIKSIGIALLLYPLVGVLGNLASGLFALRYYINSEVYLNSIRFDIDAYSKKWNYTSVFLIYFGGPIAVFLTGIGAFIGYRIAWQFKMGVSYFLGWLHLVCFLWFFADLAAGQALKKGAYIGFDYLFYLLHMPELWHYVIGVIALILLFITGAVAGIRFLKAIPSIDMIVYYGNRVIITRMLFLPSLLSLGLLALASVVTSGISLKYNIIVCLIAAALLVSTLVAGSFKELRLFKFPQTTSYTAWLVGGGVIFIASVLVFGTGLTLAL